ncbi:MAG: YIP1 family protein [Candidatus Aenigmatarchaeota archaeon]
MSIFDRWIGLVKNPEAELSRAAYDAGFASAVAQMAVASVFVGAVAGASTYFSVPQELASSAALFAGIVMAMSCASVFVGWLLLSFMALALSRIVEGRGSFAVQSYLMAFFLLPLSLVSVLVKLLPFGIFAVMLLTVYGAYLMFLSIKVAHGFDAKKAAVVALLLLLLLFVLGGVMNAIFSLFTPQAAVLPGI